MEENCCKMTEQERLTDLLSAEKFLAGIYNGACVEAATPAVRGCLCSLLQDGHRIAEEIFNEMNTRGYYPVEKAEETKITAARQKFGKTVTV